MAAVGAEILYTRRQVLICPAPPGARYSLPFFLHDGIGDFHMTDDGGRPLTWCEDIVYKASDHRLLWLDYEELDCSLEDVKQAKSRPVASGGAIVHLYFNARPLQSSDQLANRCPQEMGTSNDVMAFADFPKSKDHYYYSWEVVPPSAANVV